MRFDPFSNVYLLQHFFSFQEKMDEKTEENENEKDEEESLQPEFINIPTLPLEHKFEKAHILTITLFELEDIANRLQKKKIKFQWSQDIVNYLATKGSDSLFGIQSLKRLLEQEVKNLIAEVILAGETNNIQLILKDGKISIV